MSRRYRVQSKRGEVGRVLQVPGSHSLCLPIIVVVETEVYREGRRASSSKLHVHANPSWESMCRPAKRFPIKGDRL